MTGPKESPVSNFLLRLYARDLFRQGAPDASQTHKVIEQRLAEITDSDPARRSTRFLTLDYFKTRLRSYLAATAIEKEKAYTFNEAMQLARVSAPPVALLPERKAEIQPDLDRDLLTQALRFEGRANPLETTRENSPIDLTFRKWLEAEFSKIKGLVLDRQVVLLQRVAELNPRMAFELQAKDGSVTRAIHPAQLANLKFTGDTIYSPLIDKKPLKLRYGTHSKQTLEWVDSIMLSDSIFTDLILSNPQKAFEFLASYQEVRRARADLNTLADLLNSNHFTSRPLELQKHLASLPTKLDHPTVSAHARLWLGELSLRPTLWTKRYDSWKKFKPVLPLVTAIMDGKFRLQDLYAAAVSKSSALLKKAIEKLRTELGIAIGTSKKALSDVAMERSPGRAKGGDTMAGSFWKPLVALGAAVVVGEIVLLEAFRRTNPELFETVASKVSNGVEQVGPAVQSNFSATAVTLAAAVVMPALYFMSPKLRALLASARNTPVVRKSSEPQYFQYDARGTPTPYFIEMPNVRDLAGKSVVKSHLPTEEKSASDPRLETRIKVVPYEQRLMPLPKAMGQSIHSLQIKDEKGNLLVPEEDYEILHIPARDVYFARFKHSQSAISYSLTLSPYVEGADYPTKGETVLATGDNIKFLIHRWRDSGFEQLAQDLEAFSAAQPTLTVRDLNALMQKRNTYPLGSEVRVETLAENLVDAYQPFSREGCLNGNCGVGNGFGTASSNTLLEASDSPIRSEVRECYPVGNGGVIRRTGHVRSFFYEGDKLVDVADFTPSKLNRDDEDEKALELAFQRAMERMSDHSWGVRTYTDEERVLAWSQAQAERIRQLGQDLDIIKQVLSRQSKLNPDNFTLQAFSAARKLVDLVDKPALDQGIPAYFEKVDAAIEAFIKKASLLESSAKAAVQNRSYHSKRDALAAREQLNHSLEVGLSKDMVSRVEKISVSLGDCRFDLLNARR